MLKTNNLNFILKAAHQAPSADNSQPWLFEWHNSTLGVAYDSKRVAASTFPAESPAIVLAMGAVLENISQAAQAAALEFTLQIPDTFDKTESFYFKVLFDQQHNEPNQTIDSLPLSKRHTNRFPYQRKPLPDALLKVLKNLTLGSSRVMVFDQHTDIKQVSNLAREASEIRFRTPEVHEWLAKSLRFDKLSATTGDGLDVETLDLPFGGKAFLRLISDWRRMNIFNYFGAYKALSFIDAAPIRHSPALVAIVGPQGFRDMLHAGQLMERVWIDLNAQGVAVQPYYVISDQLHRRQINLVPVDLKNEADKVFDETQQLFKLHDGETLQMLFRIGYPQKTPVFSKRLPLQQVCSQKIE